MKNATKLFAFMGPMLFSLMLGCAPAYQSYSDCYVNCNYCPPCPLPYAQYDPCVCHATAAQPYLGYTASAPEPLEEVEGPPVPEPDVKTE